MALRETRPEAQPSGLRAAAQKTVADIVKWEDGEGGHVLQEALDGLRTALASVAEQPTPQQKYDEGYADGLQDAGNLLDDYAHRAYTAGETTIGDVYHDISNKIWALKFGAKEKS